MNIRTRALLAATIALAIVTISFTSCSDDTGELAAKVNGTAITLEELDSSVESAKVQFAAQGRTITEADTESFRSEVLENLIANELMLAYAVENDYTIEDEAFETEIAGIEAQFGSRDEFLAALEEQGFTEERLREEIRTGMIIESVFETEIDLESAVTDEEIEEFYTENPAYFEKPESLTASHIIITVEPADSDEAKREAKEKIEAIRQEIVDGADFAAVAMEKSEGPSAPRGGSLGSFTRGQMVAPFEEAAFSLEPGELSDIVLTDFGYHVILVDEKIQNGMQSIDEVSEQIKQYLTSISEQTESEKFIAGLKELATIEYFE
jgi:peptidyl-prolyl cis-trans isomerase C